MSKPAIKIEDVSKMYRLGEVGMGTLYQDLHRTWARLWGKPDPFAKVGVINVREQKGGEYVWALKDINLEVREGEILGIIGRNGAGKSTLLKLLSRVTAPTTGRMRTKGRIASLLEVGTGFHPELTGKENIYLNGAIMGMTRREITNQLEEIVEFSGCAKYIDTPVKRYSSGMTVRLGFSVAAHLECEILIVDEVLAVGDAEFQKKCLSKMGDIAKGGRTVLFVSHNMGSVRSLCSRVVLIDKGIVLLDGSPGTVISKYLTTGLVQKGEWVCQDKARAAGDETARIQAVRILDQNGQVCTNFTVRDPIYVEMEYQILKDMSWLDVGLHFRNERGDLIFVSMDDSMDLPSGERSWPAGFYRSTCRIPPDLLNNGQVYVRVTLSDERIVHVSQHDIVTFNAEDAIDPDGARGNYRWDWPPAAIRPKLQWKQEKMATKHH